MDMHNVIIRPLITEKGSYQSQALNAYSFQVNPDACKFEIRQAVEKIYDVKVLDVRTANRKGKRRRQGMRFGTTSNWKKAVVVLHPDHHIDLF